MCGEAFSLLLCEISFSFHKKKKKPQGTLMQNMLLCVINVVNPKMYNSENQLHLFPVAEFCCAHLLCILKEAKLAALMSEPGVVNGQAIVECGCFQDSAGFPNWKRQEFHF